MSIKKLPENRCQFCKKREATKLCDKVKGEYSYIGHPPKINGKIDMTIQMTGLRTCDKKMCDICATNISGMDLCPDCLAEIKIHLGAK